MTIPRFLTLLIGSIFFTVSCSNDNGGSPLDSTKPDTAQTTSTPPPQPAFQPGMQVDVKTFEVTDSAGKVSEGWGYDLLVAGKIIIHQPIRPALPGNFGFKTEEEAHKMGELAARRFSSTGSFPTINLTDYDSLGIKK